MRFQPAPLSFWANVITVGMFVLPVVFLWIGFVHAFPMRLLYFFFGDGVGARCVLLAAGREIHRVATAKCRGQVGHYVRGCLSRPVPSSGGFFRRVSV